MTTAPDWRAYAAAAGASLAATVAAEAAVQHTSLPSPITMLLTNQSHGSDMMAIDIDGEGQPDFNLLVSAATTMAFTSYTSITRRAEIAAANAGNLALGTNGLAWRLQASSVISSNLFATAGIESGVLRRSTFTDSSGSAPLFESGEWGATSSGFLGLRFAIGANNHFGWIRVRTKANALGLSGLEIHEWAYEDLPGGGILTGDAVGQAPALAGDYDRSGTVDTQDYQFWKNTFGTSVVPGIGADGNGDANVNAADYLVWRNHVDTSLSASSTIPEPASCSLAVLALGATGVRLIRRQARQ